MMLGINIDTMDRSEQHRKNARDERLWMTQARNDQVSLHQSAVEMRKHGEIVRANFMEHESEIAGSFMQQRKAMLGTEVRLGKR